jgi:phosphate-selective porin
MEIGQVTTYSDMEQLSGNFSNVYKKGTKYYSIKGISTDESIAVQEEKGKYKKAIREEKYAFGGTSEDISEDTFKEKIINFSDIAVKLLVLFTIIIFIILLVMKKIKR